MAYSFQQLEALWIQAGGSSSTAALAASVALAESTGNPAAVSPAGAIGLWQILPSAHPQYDRARLTEPLYNARAAVAISNHGADWHPWDVAWTDCKRGTQGGVYAPTGASCSGRIYQANIGGLTGPTPPAPKHDTPHTQHPSPKGVVGPVGVTKMSVTEAWTKHLTYALGRTIPSQDRETRALLRQIPRPLRYERKV